MEEVVEEVEIAEQESSLSLACPGSSATRSSLVTGKYAAGDVAQRTPSVKRSTRQTIVKDHQGAGDELVRYELVRCYRSS